ncbi:hypothetical protein [Streptomyces fradiae]|uniref:hypothetical protein n=1 Tax=Streptomyces fradiae TaxID=1906 RepID=UPI0036F8FE70
MTITNEQVLTILETIATDDDLYDRFLTAAERLTAAPRGHDGHAPDALTVEELAADIAARL